MIFKQVKEYSKRQRIDLNKNDGLTPGEEVAILTAREYENIKSKMLQMQDTITANEKEIELLQSQEQNLKELIENVTTPIYDNHEKEMQKKDNEINQLKALLELMRNKTNQYNLELMGLNAIDIAIFRKHKKLIQNYNEEITLIGVDPKLIDAESVTPGDDR